MKVYILGCYLLLFILREKNVRVSGECEDPTKFWGPKCDMKCYCDPSRSCNDKGECVGGKCSKNFFGPSCQFRDMVALKVHPISTKEYLRDLNDLTCNPDKNANVVNLTLTITVPIHWFRIIVNDDSHIRDFSTKFHSFPCNNERKYVLDGKTVDVTCDNIYGDYIMHITGAIASSICSIYISGGRNVAIKQKTSQTSNFEEDVTKCGSANGVDADPRWYYDSGTCMKTAIDDTNPEWTVQFAQPARLSLINVHHDSEYKFQPEDYSMTIFDSGDYVIQEFHIGKTNRLYDQEVNAENNTYTVLIKQIIGVKRPFSFCEVEVFGDPTCPDDRYGLLCDGICACKKQETCNQLTGICGLGCPDGRYGFNCSSKCSANCAGGICHPFSGHCAPCLNNFVGARCDLDCKEDGTFSDVYRCKPCSPGCTDVCDKRNGHCTCKYNYAGDRCDECKRGSYSLRMSCPMCSEGCADTCDKVTGSCTCTPGYTGPRCSDRSGGATNPPGQDKITLPPNMVDCPPGVIELNCNFKCPLGCDHRCNMQGELCSCDVDFLGPLCSECEPTFYGKRCDLPCSDKCLDQICFRENGTCVACADGYKGATCEESDYPLPLEKLFAGAAMSLLLLALCCCLCKCKKFGNEKKNSVTTTESD